MITVVITTRGRPRQVMGLMESARTLARNPAEVHFVIGCDSDDLTAAYLEAHGYGIDPNVRIDVGPRPRTATEVTNRAAAKVATDYMLILGDDGVIATPDWDHMVCTYLDTIPHPELRICALNDMANPGQPTLFAMHRAWIQATGGLFDARYPFWWADSALGETYSFITGEVMPILNLVVAGKHGGWNPRLRDMPLWWRFYGATRAERLEVASTIRSTLNLAVPPNLGTLLALWKRRDEQGLPASEEIVRLIPKPTSPDDNYMAAKAAAEAYLATYAHLDVRQPKEEEHA